MYRLRDKVLVAGKLLPINSSGIVQASMHFAGKIQSWLICSTAINRQYGISAHEKITAYSRLYPKFAFLLHIFQFSFTLAHQFVSHEGSVNQFAGIYNIR